MVVYAVSVAVCSSSSPRTSSSRFMICFPGLILSEVGTSCSVVEFSGFRLGISLVLHFMLAGASDGFSSSSFSSSVLDGYRRVMVLVFLTVTACVRSSLTSQHYMGLLELLVVVREAIVCRLGSDYGVIDAIGELFLGGSLSLRADSSGSPKLSGSGSRLNLVHLFAASCWCELVDSGTAVVFKASVDLFRQQLLSASLPSEASVPTLLLPKTSQYSHAPSSHHSIRFGLDCEGNRVLQSLRSRELTTSRHAKFIQIRTLMILKLHTVSREEIKRRGLIRKSLLLMRKMCFFYRSLKMRSRSQIYWCR
ncbi:hypothetical protein IGI04_007953 [Brassica rapa subsp. trilocularis]|uniref:Secreted protein n=1 Tax=Brassica rapa subsp. trilocularis TaxID=1813537 RepID=A0ABQ7NL92_BRACM|nr:hypothetical protein IGI04_007953 [Brassica rapa subsp. trilocularis]